MAEEETNEDTQTSEGDEESSVLKLQRARADAAEAELATMKAANEEAAAAVQQLREEAVTEIVNARGIPNLKDDVLRWVEGEITPATVESALQAKGLNFVQEGATQPAPEALQSDALPTQSPVPVSTLGQQVADAASGQQAQSLEERLAATKTPAEVVALNVEAGTVVSYT